MSTSTLVSDREYIEGQFAERNRGQWDHSWVQAEVILFFAQFRKTLGLLAVPGLHVQVKSTRYRIPDVAVVRGNPGEQILTRPPFICIEILSPDDAMSSMQEKIDDFLAFGVENIWIIDPRRKKAFWADSNGIHESANGVLYSLGAQINLDLAAMWPSLT